MQLQLKMGTWILFEKAMNDVDPIPFGVGILLEDATELTNRLKIQWVGNANCDENGPFTKCWYQATQNKIYFQNNPLHFSHPMETNGKGASEAVVKKREVILTDSKIPFLDSNHKLTIAAKAVINSSIWIKEERNRNLQLAEKRKKKRAKA